jgi:hypothetical protein
MIDINTDLSIDSDIIISNIKKSNSSSQNRISIMVPENNLLKPPFQNTNLSKDSFESALNDITDIIVEKLITFIIKKHNDNTFDHIRQLIEQQISRFHQSSNEIFKWLSKIKLINQHIFIFWGFLLL